MPYLSLTTWSLHRNLGPLRWTRWDDAEEKHVQQVQDQPETIRLLDLPAVLKAKGFQSIEVCHFNFPSTEEDYLKALRQAFADTGMTFYTLLIDYGDISSANEVRREADLQFIERWIDIAGQVGAQRVRVIGGDADPNDQAALARSAAGLNRLQRYAAERGVRVVTENFHPLTSTSDNCLHLLEQCDRRIGLTSDFGNFALPDKYEHLAKTVPLSESIHAKAQCDAEGRPDPAEFARCLNIVKDSGYEGPITLVYDGPGDLWAGIDRVQKLVEPYLK
jgi:sugar phosphate isomerase/epimerase